MTDTALSRSTANNGIKDGTEPTASPDANNGVAVGQGDVVVFSITRRRQSSSLFPYTTLFRSGGQTTLNIGSSVGGNQVDFQQTGLAGAAPLSTGANPVDTGSYYVIERAHV